MIKQKNIKEICSTVRSLIENPKHKVDYQNLLRDLYSVLSNKIELSDMIEFSDIVLKVTKVKSRQLRHWESDFWVFINKIPVHFISLRLISDRNEMIEPYMGYDNEYKNILSKLLELSIKILELPIDKTKACGRRRTKALKYMIDLSIYYYIPNLEQIFINSLNSKFVEEQWSALEGLEMYYTLTDKVVEDSLVATLNDLFANTKDRSVASTCLQIQINAGLIDEFAAVCLMDDWKYDNH